jgi:Collagen triple helix repeat (20 copies)
MASRLREPFGKAGLIVAVIALVAALVGGAYAANTSGKRHHKKKNNAGLNSKQKKQVKSIAKSEATKAQGTGPAGPQGPAGANGNDGSNGANGSNGADGKEGPQGKQGIQGEKGNPWTAGGTLPPGETEMGNWDATATVPNGNPAQFAISFSIPLAEPSENVVYLNREETENSAFGEPKQGCELEVEELAAKPVAPPGTLCVFTREEAGAGIFNFIGNSALYLGDSPAGAFIWFHTASPTGGYIGAAGTWAVTAAE